MKKKALAIVLALCMILSMLPMTAFAAQPKDSGKLVPNTVGTLEPAAVAPNAKSYSVSLTGSSHGTVELLVDTPCQAGSEVYFLADPDDGYLAEIYYEGLSEDAMVYLGADVFGFLMPANKVTLEVKFVAAEGDEHRIDVVENGSGQCALSRERAKEYESVLLAVKPSSAADFDPLQYVFANSGMLYYLYEEEGIHYYELFMPDEDVKIFVNYKKSGPFRVSAFRTSGEQSCTVKIEPEKAYFLDTVTVTIIPSEGYELSRVKAVSYAGDLVTDLTPIGNNQYTFTMHPGNVDVYIDTETNSYPVTVKHTVGGTATVNEDMAAYGMPVSVVCIPDEGYRVESVTGVEDGWWHTNTIYIFNMPNHAVDVFVTFKPIYNPITVTVDTGIGGTAFADLAEAKAGDTVTLTCAPEEGYRVAQITGVGGIVDNGDNTYTFTMPDEAVAIKVLFLRHENPFLDVNETHFFYESVLWAVEKGITNGIDDTHFGPFAVCNRAQVVTFLWRSAGSPEPTITENPFTDVPAESWYTKAVLWALENGITTGATETLFDPNGVCMRAHVVTFLWRAKGCPEPVTTVNPFVDVTESDFYYKAVLWALENGVTTGADATHFNPLGQCQRAQVVTFLYRADGIPAVHELHWVINGFQDTPSDYGTVTLSHAKAAAGTTITATVVPAEGYVLDWAKCEFGTPVTQVSDTEYTFVMPDHEEVFHVNFSEAPEEPEPTDPVDPEPTDPTEPEPTDPVDPEPTDPTEPEEPTKPVKTYELDLKDNGCGSVSYVDGKTEAAVGESIFFYAIPDEGYYLDHVSIFNPTNTIDVSSIRIIEHGDDLYELIMIPHDLIMTCYFYPIA